MIFAGKLDLYATRFFFRHLALLRPGNRIPILMYHSVSNEACRARSAYYETTTTPGVFGAQMRFLREKGYRSIGLDDIEKCLDCGEDIKSFVITFDDGYMDFYTEAFPAIEECGFKATVFVPTQFIGKSPRKLNGRDCLTWGLIRELQKRGIEIGSHTVSHPQLLRLRKKELRYEINGSKEEIEERTGTEVRAFSYPYAFPEGQTGFIGHLREILLDAGYKSGVSTVVGTVSRGDDRLFYKRLPVNQHDGSRLLEAKLNGGYDWVHALQYASKMLKSKVLKNA